MCAGGLFERHRQIAEGAETVAGHQRPFVADVTKWVYKVLGGKNDVENELRTR